MYNVFPTGLLYCSGTLTEFYTNEQPLSYYSADNSVTALKRFYLFWKQVFRCSLLAFQPASDEISYRDYVNEDTNLSFYAETRMEFMMCKICILYVINLFAIAVCVLPRAHAIRTHACLCTRVLTGLICFSIKQN